MKSKAILPLLALFGLALILAASAGQAQGPEPQGEGFQAARSELSGTAFRDIRQMLAFTERFVAPGSSPAGGEMQAVGKECSSRKEVLLCQ